MQETNIRESNKLAWGDERNNSDHLFPVKKNVKTTWVKSLSTPSDPQIASSRKEESKRASTES